MSYISNFITLVRRQLRIGHREKPTKMDFLRIFEYLGNTGILINGTPAVGQVVKWRGPEKGWVPEDDLSTMFEGELVADLTLGTSDANGLAVNNSNGLGIVIPRANGVVQNGLLSLEDYERLVFVNPDYTGVGDPNGIVTAPINSSYWDKQARTWWYKETGDNTDTGWIQQATGNTTPPVVSVNGKIGVVVVTPDDLDDSATAHKFVDQALITKVGTLNPAEAIAADRTRVENGYQIGVQSMTPAVVADSVTPLSVDIDIDFSSNPMAKVVFDTAANGTDPRTFNISGLNVDGDYCMIIVVNGASPIAGNMFFLTLPNGVSAYKSVGASAELNDQANGRTKIHFLRDESDAWQIVVDPQEAFA